MQGARDFIKLAQKKVVGLPIHRGAQRLLTSFLSQCPSSRHAESAKLRAKLSGRKRAIQIPSCPLYAHSLFSDNFKLFHSTLLLNWKSVTNCIFCHHESWLGLIFVKEEEEGKTNATSRRVHSNAWYTTAATSRQYLTHHFTNHNQEWEICLTLKA